MDRLDRLADGRTIVIDYKSGVGRTFQPLDVRPEQPQLLAYALLAAGEVAGVASVHLCAGAVSWRGATDGKALLPDLAIGRAPTAPWPELLRHWRQTVEALVQGFTAGAAPVNPRGGACDHCHLPALCRIDPAVQPDAEADPGRGLDPQEPGHGA
jgi:RecB family exonuclease